MNKDLMTRAERDAWTAALRSGEYKQGTGYLCTSNKYCCLGVKADLDEALKHKGGRGYIVYIAINPGISYSMYYPNGVSESTVDRLAHMNDEGEAFANIADWIEQNIEVQP